MDRDRLRNGVGDAMERARDVAGDVLSGARSRLDRRAHQAAGRAEDAYEATLDSLESAAKDRPLQTLALALAVGFILGLLALRR